MDSMIILQIQIKIGEKRDKKELLGQKFQTESFILFTFTIKWYWFSSQSNHLDLTIKYPWKETSITFLSNTPSLINDLKIDILMQIPFFDLWKVISPFYFNVINLCKYYSYFIYYDGLLLSIATYKRIAQ